MSQTRYQSFNDFYTKPGQSHVNRTQSTELSPAKPPQINPWLKKSLTALKVVEEKDERQGRDLPARANFLQLKQATCLTSHFKSTTPLSEHNSLVDRSPSKNAWKTGLVATVPSRTPSSNVKGLGIHLEAIEEVAYSQGAQAKPALTSAEIPSPPKCIQASSATLSSSNLLSNTPEHNSPTTPPTPCYGSHHKEDSSPSLKGPASKHGLYGVPPVDYPRAYGYVRRSLVPPMLSMQILPRSPQPIITAMSHQLSYYFSACNLGTDLYLRSLFDPVDGGIPLGEIAKFKRIREMAGSDDPRQLLREAIVFTHSLELMDGGDRVRAKSWKTWMPKTPFTRRYSA